jgi:molecular chaperone DnaK (HSP70)
MAHVNCAAYIFRREDRYCGLCGAPLPRLKVAFEGQVDVLPNATGKVPLKTRVWNMGKSDLRLTLEESSDPPGVKVLGEREFLLNREADPTEVRFEVDVAVLRPRRVLTLPYESDDPLQPRGEFRVCVAEPGTLELEVDTVRLGRMPAGAGNKIPFEVSVRNIGGTRVQVTVAQQGTDASLKVALAEGREAWVSGYETSSLRFVVWSEAAPGRRDEPIRLQLDHVAEGTQRWLTVRLEAEVFRPPLPPLPQIPVVDFGVVVPGEHVTWTGAIKNGGSEPFKITAIEPLQEEVRVLTRCPLEVPSGVQGATLELFFCASEGDPRWQPEERAVNGAVRLYTDIPGSAPAYARWQAGVFAPQEEELGILAADFGTVNSCVGYYNQGVLSLLDEKGPSKGIIPSLIGFPDRDLCVVGERAQEMLTVDPENVVGSIKRFLVQGDRKFHGRSYSPVELASLVIKQLLLRATKSLHAHPKRIALCVPANFWGPLRKAMIEACQRAWDVMPEVIDEPTAAALYYVHQNVTKFGEEKAWYFLVFDFGGGTLDVSVVKLEAGAGGPRKVGSVIARGNNRFGGIDIDLRVLRAMANEAHRVNPEFNLRPIECYHDDFENETAPAFKDTLRRARLAWNSESERAKVDLSSRDKTKFEISNIHDREAMPLGEFAHDLDRAQFEGKIMRGLVKDAQELVLSTIDACGLDAAEIDVLLLAGQSSKIPCIRKAVKDLFPRAECPSAESFPLKPSVALGAAFAMDVLQSAGASLDIHHLERTSYRYGVLLTRPWGYDEFLEVIPLEHPFAKGVAPVTVKLGTSGDTYLKIAQHAGKYDRIVERNRQGLVCLGTVRVSRGEPPREKVQLSLRFTEDGALEVTIDGKTMPLIPPQESMYL